MTRILAALCVLLAAPAYGASFYISTTGSDTNGCTNQTTDACASFPRCSERMSPGDTCYALDGTYEVWDTNPTSHANQGWVFNFVSAGGPAARYRFTSLSQDPTKVVIKRAGNDSATKDTWKIVGGVGGTDRKGENIEIDHVTLEGRFQSYGSYEDILYHHNICRCPNTGTGGGNQGCFYTARASDDMHGGINIYENMFVYDASCPTLGTNTSISFIVLYDVNGGVIEKNDFIASDASRPLAKSIFLKRMNKDMVIRYNFMDFYSSTATEGIEMMDCDGEFYWGQAGDRSDQGGSATCNDQVYQNIIVGAENALSLADSGVQKQVVYNNTIVSPTLRCFGGNWDRSKHCSTDVPPSGGACTSDTQCPGGTCIDDPVPVGTGWEYFNNICYASSGKGFFNWETYGDTNFSCMSDQDYIDNNMSYPAGTSSQRYTDCYASVSGDQNYSTLAAWQAHLSGISMEQNSREADPQFENLAGKNYRLAVGSPALSGGRGGSYPSVLGAYVTGSEQIGCSFYSGCYSYGAATAVFGNIRRVDLKGVSVK